MSIGRAVSRAARAHSRASKAQSRGLMGERNSQGDFMPERIQEKALMESVEPDIQNLINDVITEWDELQIEGMEIYHERDMAGAPAEWKKETDEILQDIKNRQDKIINDLIEKLEEEGVEVPPEIREIQGENKLNMRKQPLTVGEL